ncbi:hypothetical protein P9112_008556 [Eukaryota sp. TZLM1-RC]
MSHFYNLNEYGIELLASSGINALHNSLLVTISKPVLPSSFSDTVTTVSGPHVLELCSLPINASEPKHAARNVQSSLVTTKSLVRCHLTDGFTRFLAVVVSPVPNFNINSIPGTKLLLKNYFIISKTIVLTPDSATVIGGRVSEMVEKYSKDRESLAANLSALEGSTHSGRPLFQPIPRTKGNERKEKHTGMKHTQGMDGVSQQQEQQQQRRRQHDTKQKQKQTQKEDVVDLTSATQTPHESKGQRTTRRGYRKKGNDEKSAEDKKKVEDVQRNVPPEPVEKPAEIPVKKSHNKPVSSEKKRRFVRKS